MEYIKDIDYQYIMNKYHNSDLVLAHDTYRFMRNDGIFDTESGMDGDAIIEGIKKQDEKIKNLSHPVRKAKAFEFVLKNTRISCDSRDRFPAINMVNRPINKVLVSKWNAEVFNDIIPEVAKQKDNLESNGVATIWADYDHSVPNWERIFAFGFKGLMTESEQQKERKNSQKILTEEQKSFYEGIRITYQAIIDFIGRLAEMAEKTENSDRLAKALKRIKVDAPQTFYEALLVDYLYFILCEHIEGLQVRSLCNFDRILYRFYKKDIESGVTEEEIRIDLAYFFLQFVAIGNYWGQPVYLGGCKEDESTQINELSYIFLDVYDKMGIYNPKIQIKISDSTPKDFILKALDMIRRGNNSIVFVSDALIRKSLENYGFDKEEARLADVKGCYEYSPCGCVDIGMNYINLMKPLEYAMHEGCDGLNGFFAGRKSPSCKEYKCFDDFYNEYKEQLKFLIDSVIEIVNSFEDYLAYINPQSMLSTTIFSCIEAGKDALGGGASANDSDIAFGFIADIADSLTVIKKYVFERKELTLEQLKAILDTNFKGNEILRNKLLLDIDKYGNNRPLPDLFAQDIIEFAANYTSNRSNSKIRGGKWCCGFHVARQSYQQGAVTLASPNGRLLGEELSKNISPSMGMNREGATAAILSATKINASLFVGDASLDLGLLPSAVKGEDGLEAMYGLLMTFVKRGGHAMHINVFDAETLREAQREPEKYSDLQIRVCGWNVLFNNICKEEQDGFIKQAEGLI